jgi:hypothetical protein
MGNNIYEDEARTRKVLKLAEVFRAKDATSDQVAKLDKSGWTAASELAGIHNPSAETRASVVSALRAGEETRAKYAADPFAGFPKGTAW